MHRGFKDCGKEKTIPFSFCRKGNKLAAAVVLPAVPVEVEAEAEVAIVVDRIVNVQHVVSNEEDREHPE